LRKIVDPWERVILSLVTLIKIIPIFTYYPPLYKIFLKKFIDLIAYKKEVVYIYGGIIAYWLL